MSDSDSDASMPGLVSNSESDDDSSEADEPFLSQDAEDAEEVGDPEAGPAEPAGPTGVVEGLESRPELNGVRVELLGFNADRGRWVVREIGDGWRRRGESSPWGGASATSVARAKVRIDDGPSLDRADMIRRQEEEGAREAAAREAAELPFSAPEPEPEEAAAEAAAEAERERKRKKAERKKEQQRRARERKRLEQQDKQQAEGGLSPTIPELAPRERMERVEQLTNVALSEWKSEQAAEWASLIEFDALKEDVRVARLQLLLLAFQEEAIDGDELRTMSEKRLRRMLERAPKRVESIADEVGETVRTVIELRDAVLAAQRAVDGSGDAGGSATGADLAALKSSLEKEKHLRLNAEEEKSELQQDLDDVYAQQNKATLEDRRMKEYLSGVRQSFLDARRDYGFRFPVRQMGELDDST